MTKPITEARLRNASQRAVAGGHARAAILFGSRARGTAAPESDWDVCLITDEDGRSAQERDTAIETQDAFWEDGRIERVWVPLSQFEAGVHANSLNEAISREGKVLAGDATMAKRARVLPFDAEMLRKDMGRSAQQLGEAINAARSHARETDEEEALQTSMTMSLRAIGAVEALGRALCALTHTAHTGAHDVGTNGRQIRERAAEPEAPLDSALMEQIGTRLEAMNGDSRKLRGAEYGHPAENHEQATERLVLALDTDALIRRGLVEGKGAWAKLKDHPRREELKANLERNTAARANRNARDWILESVKLPSNTLSNAVVEWVRTCQDIRIARKR